MKVIKNNFDVTIIGGGAVGLTLASLLANSSISVLLVESKTSKVNILDKRTVVLSRSSVELYYSLGLWGKISKHAWPIKTVHTHVAKKFGASRIEANKFGVSSLGYVVNLAAIEEILSDYLALATNVTYIVGSSLTSCKLNDSKWQLEFSASINNLDNVTSAILIAADGKNSYVCKTLGIKHQIRHYDQGALICNVEHSADSHHVAYERFMLGGALALLPFSKYESTLVWTYDLAKVRNLFNLSDLELLSVIQEEFGYRLGRFVAVSKRFSVELSMQIAEKETDLNLVIIGNAAHTLHPIAAQGLNLSLREIKCLVDLLLNNKDQDKNFDMLCKYVELIERDQKQIIAATNFLVDYASADFIPGKLKSLGLMLFDALPVVKDTFTRIAVGGYV